MFLIQTCFCVFLSGGVKRSQLKQGEWKRHPPTGHRYSTTTWAQPGMFFKHENWSSLTQVPLFHVKTYADVHLPVIFQTSSPPPSSSPPKLSEEAGSTPEVVTQQLNGSSAASAIGQPLELASLAQPIPCALASRDNQSEGVEVEAPCCLDDCPSDGALQKEE